MQLQSRHPKIYDDIDASTAASEAVDITLKKRLIRIFNVINNPLREGLLIYTMYLYIRISASTPAGRLRFCKESMVLALHCNCRLGACEHAFQSFRRLSYTRGLLITVNVLLRVGKRYWASNCSTGTYGCVNNLLC